MLTGILHEGTNESPLLLQLKTLSMNVADVLFFLRKKGTRINYSHRHAHGFLMPKFTHTLDSEVTRPFLPPGGCSVNYSMLASFLSRLRKTKGENEVLQVAGETVSRVAGETGPPSRCHYVWGGQHLRGGSAPSQLLERKSK